ncbi:putative protein PHYTOCHROME KINASE SUBSTRATE 4 [Iris pallida]|uniref:Uncharacterized protein n=1 Tax=Iris pallida TaxID=29817 RepID=A0AAX6GUK2_IRIPA|nr:putative protein PHYTOCHROME KINASE SUBSTRATE 4 [Iris pallida]
MERERLRTNYTANLSPEPNNFHLPPKPPLSLSRRIRDAEISIFDAERYFNEGDEDADALKKKKMNITPNGAGITASFVDGSSANPRDSSVDGGYRRNYFPTARSFRATPAASSEASWNSQTGLLAKSNPPVSAVSVSVSVRAYNSFSESRKGSSSSTSTSSLRGRRFFGRHCACYGKKSVEVENKFRETSSPIRPQSHHSSNADQGFPKPPEEAMEMTKFRISATEPGPYSLPAADIGRRIVNSGVGGGFSFPVLISVATALPLVEELEEPARASLEVFQPSVELARILGKSTSAPIQVADDMACDGASSDLFELESFSAPSSTAYRRRRGASLHELPELATATAGAGAR